MFQLLDQACGERSRHCHRSSSNCDLRSPTPARHQLGAVGMTSAAPFTRLHAQKPTGGRATHRSSPGAGSTAPNPSWVPSGCGPTSPCKRRPMPRSKPPPRRSTLTPGAGTEMGSPRSSTLATEPAPPNPPPATHEQGEDGCCWPSHLVTRRLACAGRT